MARRRAFNLIRREVHYRRDAFDAGLKACGYEIHERPGGEPQPGDLLVIWNRYGMGHSAACRFEQAGCPVIVAENGYLGRSENAHRKVFTTLEQTPLSHLYALALNHHNGGGLWRIGEAGRWREQGIALQPWRDGDDDGRGHIVILPQRGIGPPGVAQPQNWLPSTVTWLRARTHRPIVVREHPGNSPAKTPLADDLTGAWAVVCWGSGAAIKGMIAGVPAYSSWNKWIGFPAALPLDQIGLDNPPHWWEGLPLTADAARETMLNRLAWAQWTVAEITTGEPFRRLLAMHHERAKAA